MKGLSALASAQCCDFMRAASAQKRYLESPVGTAGSG